MKINNIKLNFLDKYYMFYEWLNTDDIKTYDNILVLKVTTEDIKNIMNNKIKLKTKLSDNIIIFTDLFDYIAVQFINEKSWKKSSLLLDDEFRIETKLDLVKETSLDYQIISEDNQQKDLRYNEEVRDIIKKEITNQKDSSKLDYLYYEWFNKKQVNKEKMINQMLNQLNKPISQKEIELYKIIKNYMRIV